jgi:hypothetical protein
MGIRRRFTRPKGSKATAEPDRGSSSPDDVSVPQNEKCTSKGAPEPSPTAPKRKSIAADAIEKYEKQVGFNTKEYLEGLGTVETPSNDAATHAPAADPEPTEAENKGHVNLPATAQRISGSPKGIRARWLLLKTKIISADQAIHRKFASRVPRMLPRIDAALEWVFGTTTSGAFQIVSGLIAAVILLVKPNLIVAIVALAWFITALWVARSKFVKKLTIGSRTLVMIIFGILFGSIFYAFGSWASREYQNQQAKPQSQPVTSATSAEPMLKENELEGNVFLSEKYPAIGDVKTFTFFGIKNYGVVTIRARFGLSDNFTIILLVHSTEDEPGIAAMDCLTAINNYQAIVDDLKTEARQRSLEFVDFVVHPDLVCHYDYKKDITPEASEALKRIALRKNLNLSIEGPRGPK